MIVAKITQQQAQELDNLFYSEVSCFNPIQDKNGQWIISLQELTYCSVEFASSVELIEFEPIELTSTL